MVWWAARQTDATAAVVSAAIGVLAISDIVSWTDDQVGAVMLLDAAILVVVRRLVMPRARE